MNREMNFLSSFSFQLDLFESEGRYLEMSNCILNMMVKNVDLSPLAGKIIKFLAIQYPPCKKVLYTFLTRYSTNIADLNILATNSLLKDFQDPNPFIRRLVIKAICSIPCLFELAFQLLPQALCDNSSYVRCTAASACSLVIKENNVKDNQEIIDKLYEMIRDPDATVVCSSLSALNEILHSDGGVVVNTKMIFYLLSRISDFQDWNVAVICSVMKKYRPKSTEELLRFMNALDEKLLDTNPAIFTLASDLALCYIQQCDRDFSEDVLQQIFPQLKLLLTHSNAETLASVLEIIETYVSKHKAIFISSYKLFLCCFCDTTVVKVKKLKILTELISSNNVSDIADELLSHCCNNVKEVSQQAVHSFTVLIKQHPELKTYLNTFVSFMDIQHNDLNEDILNSLSVIDLKGSPHIKNCVLAAVSKHAHVVNNVESKLCVLKFIGKYGGEIEDSPYVIERIVNDEPNFEDEKLTSVVLTTTVKLFLARPEEMQLLLGFVLQNCQKSSCLLIRKQASLYYHLLKDVSILKRVMRIDEITLPNNGSS